jgi:hypothetical protein
VFPPALALPVFVVVHFQHVEYKAKNANLANLSHTD